jgi:hypothetical protein
MGGVRVGPSVAAWSPCMASGSAPFHVREVTARNEPKADLKPGVGMLLTSARRRCFTHLEVHTWDL